MNRVEHHIDPRDLDRDRERERKVQTVGLDGEEPTVTESLVKICARAATGGEAVEQWRRRWSFPSLAAPP
jgi:hypothetical protein